VTNRWQGWQVQRRRAVELLEEPHMEDVMEASLRWKSQSDGDLVDELDDAVRGCRSSLKRPHGGVPSSSWSWMNQS
jgi:hypothetical protein